MLCELTPHSAPPFHPASSLRYSKEATYTHRHVLCRLQKPELPCIQVGTRQKPNYLPMELTHIAKGQRKSKISEGQKNAMLTVATRDPGPHKDSVQRAVHNSGMADNDSLHSFAMTLDKEMMLVCSCLAAGLCIVSTILFALHH